MRLYTLAELEKELRDKWGLTKTDQHTANTVFWKTGNGCVVAVPVLPDGDRYPDYILDLVVKELERLGQIR